MTQKERDELWENELKKKIFELETYIDSHVWAKYNENGDIIGHDGEALKLRKLSNVFYDLYEHCLNTKCLIDD